MIEEKEAGQEIVFRHLQKQQSESRLSRRYWTIGIALVITLLYLGSGNGIQFFHSWYGGDYVYRKDSAFSSSLQEDLKFDWSTLKPSTDLQYSSCFHKFYCARLEVPVNWNSTKDSKFNLAIIKKPANVDVTHPKYGGVILFNPGGPAASGVDFIHRYGGSFDRIFNTGDKYYDLLGWDPRGAGDTTPSINGLANLARHDYDQKLLDLMDSAEHEEGFNRFYDMKGLYGKFVSEGLPVGDEDHPVQFIGTANVVRDMVEIIERHGKWREAAARKVMTTRRKSGWRPSKIEIEAIQQRTAHRKGSEMLQYWGGSYGTVLGQTFASTYPERVERLVIDGVVNITDWYAGELRNMLSGARAITKNFTTECEAAGSARCEFAALSPTTGDALMHKWNELFSDLYKHPITDVVKANPVYVTNSLIKMIVFSGWYTGWYGYKAVGDIMHNLALRNASFFVSPPDPNACGDAGLTAFDMTLATTGIFCSDGEKRRSRDEYKEYVSSVEQELQDWGLYWAWTNPACQHWPSIKDSPSWRYAGPFGARKTVNPILVLSQTLDPVTPLINAQDAAKRFSAQLVEAQGIGHTSFAYPSVCAMKELKRYFDTGKVLSNYTYCSASIKPFQTMDEVIEMMKDMPVEDRYILASLLRIGSDWPPGNPAIDIVKGKLSLPGREAGDWWVDQDVSFTESWVQAQYYT